MPRRGRVAAIVLAVVIAVGVAVLAISSTGRDSDRSPASPGSTSPATPKPPSGSPTGPRPTVTPRPENPGHPPPPGTVQVAGRYLTAAGARRVGWAELVGHGRPLPPVDSDCRRAWRSSGKDRRLDWSSTSYLCLDVLSGGHYRPQGIAGSATTSGYAIGPSPAARRNLVLTSWYSRAREPGLVAPNSAGESVTRLVVLDLDRRRYATVELVRPDGRSGFANLNSHGSGLAWTGQYLYASSHSQLWMFNADDLVSVAGRFVLPAAAHWRVSGDGGLSSISLDRSAAPERLLGINYSTKGRAYVHTLPLARDGLLAQQRVRRRHDLRLTNEFGERGRVVHSERAQLVPGTNYQGVARVGRHTYANSSSLRIGTSGRTGSDALAVFRNNTVLDTIQMPQHSGESLYVDYSRDRLLSLVEGGRQFLFAVPLSELKPARHR